MAGKTPTEMGLAVTLKVAWTVESLLELCFLCVLMKANLHAEIMDLSWLFFVVGICNVKLKVGWVDSQLHQEDTMEQDVVAITYVLVRLP